MQWGTNEYEDYPDPRWNAYECKLQERIDELENAIRKVVTQEADNICFADVYIELGKLVGIEVTFESLKLLPEHKFRKNCDHFTTCLYNNLPYVAPEK